jgi:hypothetical protein
MLIGCLRIYVYNGTTEIRISEDIAIVTFDDYDFVSAMESNCNVFKIYSLRDGNTDSPFY